MGLNLRGSIGTLLMGVGLLLVLSAGGYFAWTEVQAVQVRSELDQTSAAAAVRATRMAREVASMTETARSAAPGPSATPRAVASPRTSTPTGKPAVARGGAALSATGTSTSTSTPTATDTATATAVPTATPAPVLPVRLVIPDLKIDTSVVEMGWDVVQTKSGPVSEWSLPQYGAGHSINSATIGQPDNLVISGHNNIYGRVFMPISQAWQNDGRVKVDNYTDRSKVLNGREIYLYDAAGNRYNYVITDFLRVRDSGVSQKQREINGRFMQPTGREQVTIITCWPPTNNTHRLVVIALPEE